MLKNKNRDHRMLESQTAMENITLPLTSKC